MANKTIKKVQKDVEVTVETPVVNTLEVETEQEDVKVETPDNEEAEEETEAEVKVEAPANDEVKVDLNFDDSKKPENNVKIRMRTDHKCTIGGELYQLESGKVYTVPENVKRILNKAGLLSPL